MSNNSTVCVVGSGVTGVSAAKALLERNIRVLMIDAGLSCPDDIQKKVESIKEVPAWKWTDEQKAVLQKGVESSSTGVKEKLQFGSNYSSKEIDSYPITKQNTKFYVSYAEGGLSNIWGAGLLPMAKQDMMGWPIGLEDLTPHYRDVLKFMPLAGQHDALEALLPLYCEPKGHGFSRQTLTMLARMNRNKEKLGRLGLHFGASRLAACFHGGATGVDCQYCGMCMYGCPYNLLYSSKSTLEELKKSDLFEYRSGVVVKKLQQDGGNVVVYGDNLDGSPIDPVRVSKVILASGAPSSTRIILSTLGLVQKKVILKSSDQYYLPLFSLSGNPKIDYEQKHTMCQSYWVLQNPSVHDYLVHFSVYTHNDLYGKAIKSICGSSYKYLELISKIPLSRLHFMFCYLHSDDSGWLEACLENDTSGTFKIKGVKNAKSKQIFSRARKTLKKAGPSTGLFPVPFYSGEKLPGAGNHFGCSFPMRKNPEGLETDIYGRIPGLDRIHLVDSSVFPSITATTITLSIMANAHRIASSMSL